MPDIIVLPMVLADNVPVVLKTMLTLVPVLDAVPMLIVPAVLATVTLVTPVMLIPVVLKPIHIITHILARVDISLLLAALRKINSELQIKLVLAAQLPELATNVKIREKLVPLRLEGGSCKKDCEAGCSGYSLSSCPSNANCNSCTKKNSNCSNGSKVYKITSCKSGYTLSGSRCVEDKKETCFGSTSCVSGYAAGSCRTLDGKTLYQCDCRDVYGTGYANTFISCGFDGKLSCSGDPKISCDGSAGAYCCSNRYVSTCSSLSSACSSMMRAN